MDKNYKLHDFERDLNNGYKIFLTYVNNRYLIYKTTENCYPTFFVGQVFDMVLLDSMFRVSPG